MNRLMAAKRIAAITLALSFFLPLSSCTNTDMSAYSAYEWPSIGSSIAVMLFFWPLVAVLVNLRNPQPTNAIRLLVEVNLCIATLSGITWLLFWGQSIRYGAVIAYLSIIGYGYALVACYLSWRHRLSRHAL